MARSFRHGTLPLRSVADRPRLLQVLRRRFDVTATCIVAGAGFGKSVLLSQALRDNVVAPRGTDVWLSCEPADALTTNLLSGLADAAQVDLRVNDTGADLLVTIAQELPAGVCVVLDDVHLIPEGSPGAAALAAMVGDPPPGVSFVLASRQPIRGIARLRSQGRTVELDEADLALRPGELPGVTPEVTADLGGWPALVSLSTSFDLDVAREFLTEELLVGLDEGDVAALAALSLIGGADVSLAAEVLDEPFDPVALSQLPLVHDDGEHLVPHALWAELLADRLDPARRRTLHRRVGAALLDRGQAVRAGASFIAGEDVDGVREALRTTCAGGFATAPVDVMRSWWEALDEAARSCAEGRLLDALLERARDPYAASTLESARAAVSAARDAGDVGLEIAALWEYGFVARGRGEIEAMLTEVPRVVALEAAGERRASALATLARSLISEAMGDHETAESAMSSLVRSEIPAGWRPSIEYMQMVFAYRRGDLDAANAAATTFDDVAPADFPGRELFGVWCDWMNGRTPADWDQVPLPSDVAGSTPADRIWTGPMVGIVFANALRVPPARRAVEEAEAASAGIVLPATVASVAGARAALLVAEGDEPAAAATLSELVGTNPEGIVVHERAVRQVLAIAHVLVPALAEHWSTTDLGPLHLRVRRLAEAVRRVRDGRPAPVLSRDDVELVRTALPLRWAVELCAATQAEDELAAREMLELLLSSHGELARSCLRDAAGSTLPAVAKGASSLLAEVPIGLAGVEINVLGATHLIVDGVPADGPEWRRGRVRALACLMALRRRVRREDVIDALWPELDVDAGRHNLRVTLGYLQRCLEPQRRRGEAPFHLRQDGDWLVLLDEPHVRIDAEIFERRVGDGDRQRTNGAVSDAVAAYRQALDLWRDGCLSDVVAEEWAQPAIVRLTDRAVAAGTSLSGLLLALGDPGAAIDSARRTLSIDRWCEPAYRIIVSAHLARGDRPAAQRSLREGLGRLEELGVGPSAETAALGRRLLADDGG